MVVAAIWIATRRFWTVTADELASVRQAGRTRAYYWCGVVVQIVVWAAALQLFYLALLAGVEVTDFRYVSF